MLVFFVLKSDAITAQAAAANKIDAYIKSTFNVEKSATLTTEQKTTVNNWWKDKKRSEGSLITREDGLPQGIFLENGKFVSCLRLYSFVSSNTESCFCCIFFGQHVTIAEAGFRLQLGWYPS